MWEFVQHPTCHVQKTHFSTKTHFQVSWGLSNNDFLWIALYSSKTLYSLPVFSCCLLTSPLQQAAHVLCNVVPTLQMGRQRPRAGMWFPGGHPRSWLSEVTFSDLPWIGPLPHPDASCPAHLALYFFHINYLHLTWYLIVYNFVASIPLGPLLKGRNLVGLMHACTSAPQTAPLVGTP